MYNKMTAFQRFINLHPAAALTSAISGFGNHIAQASRLRQDRRMLSEMSDSLLADIGVSRHEIDTVTSPSAYDASLRDRGYPKRQDNDSSPVVC